MRPSLSTEQAIALQEHLSLDDAEIDAADVATLKAKAAALGYTPDELASAVLVCFLTQAP